MNGFDGLMYMFLISDAAGNVFIILIFEIGIFFDIV